MTADHTEAADILDRGQCPTVNGLELTEIVPKYLQSTNRWNAGTDPVTVSAFQIHHANIDH